MDKLLNRLIKVLVSIIIIATIYFFFPYFKSIISILFKLILPFLIGFVIAFLLLPLVDKLEKYKINRKIISIFIVLMFVAIIVVITIYGVPIVLKEIKNLLNNLPLYIENIKTLINNIKNEYPLLSGNLDSGTKVIKSIITDNTIEIFNNFIVFFQSTISYLFIIIISPIIAVYFLIDYHLIKDKVKEYLLRNNRFKIYYFFKIEEDIMRSYLYGVLLVMSILTLISTFLFFFIGLDFPLLWGTIIGITNIIPYFGPYIGGIIVLIFTLSTKKSSFFIILYTIIFLQIIESNFITPKVESKNIKSHPLLVILALSVFGRILGFIGMLIALPLLSCIQTIIKCTKLKSMSTINDNF